MEISLWVYHTSILPFMTYFIFCKHVTINMIYVLLIDKVLFCNPECHIQGCFKIITKLKQTNSLLLHGLFKIEHPISKIIEISYG